MKTVYGELCPSVGVRLARSCECGVSVRLTANCVRGGTLTLAVCSSVLVPDAAEDRVGDAGSLYTNVTRVHASPLGHMGRGHTNGKWDLQL